MNVFNRVVVILLLLGIIVVLFIVMVAPLPTIKFLEQWLLFLEANLPMINWLIFAPAGIFSIILCILLLWLEIRRPGVRTIEVGEISGGTARVAIRSIASRLEHEITQLSGVVKATPKISGRGGSVMVKLDLETSPDIEVPAKTEEVCQVTKEVIEENLGLKLGEVTVSVRHAPYPKAQ